MGRRGSERAVFYVTTPIYYVNDRPHIGHAYCTILADVLRRYHDLFGEETFFLTGVDEHGQKVQQAAQERGLDPQEHCDEMQAHFRNLWKDLDCSNDDFIRTTEGRHKRVVQRALQELYEKGLIYKGEYEGYYSPRVEKFFTAGELVDGRCPETGGEVYKIKEPNYFFRMGQFQGQLVKYIRANPDFIMPEARRNEVLGFLSRPLGDLCISRPKSRLTWGIEFPFDSDFVTYVWFDALLNYVSAIGLYTDGGRFSRLWPGCHHLIGKDILTTHSVYWTTMLLALGIPLPKHIIATGWWLVDETKMSKSLGNVVDPLSLKDKYGVDPLRYYLVREMVIGHDASFSEVAFVKRHNSDLANDLGNLANRLSGLLARNFHSRVPNLGELCGPDPEVVEAARMLPHKVEGLVRRLRLDTAIEETLNLVRRINRFLAETEPFKVLHSDRARAGTVLRVALEGLRFALACLWPVCPKSAEMLARSMTGTSLPLPLADLKFPGLVEGVEVGLQRPPFPRVKMPATEGQAVPSPGLGPRKTHASKPGQAKDGGSVSFVDFGRFDLRVGTVVGVEAIPKASKLLKLSVDVGEKEPRTLLAGIAQSYRPEDLLGRQVVVLVNLEPKKMFGIESQGMILAAASLDGHVIVAPSEPVPPGSKVS